MNKVKAVKRELKFYLGQLNTYAKMSYANILKLCAYM
jgi:hypothetical protein